MPPMTTRSLVILSMLVVMLPALVGTTCAFEYRNENIWIYQGSFELAPGEKAELEGYMIRVLSVDMDPNDPSTVLLIYRNKDFKKSIFMDSRANNEQTYEDELKIKVLGIDSGVVSLEVHKMQFERVWITSIPETKMHVGDSLEDGAYKVRLKELGESGALISVEGKHGILEETYQTGTYRKFSGEFQVRAIYINPNTGELYIETLKPGAPAISARMYNEATICRSNENITCLVAVTNNGSIPLHGIILRTTSSNGVVGEPQIQHAVLEPSKIKVFFVPVRAPVTPVPGSMLIGADIIGYDYKGNAYTETASFEVQVSPYISIEKHVASVPTGGGGMGAEGYFRITLRVKNTADRRMSVDVKDTLVSTMIPEDIGRTEWTIQLDAGDSQDIVYNALPTEPGNYIFEKASAQWKDGGKMYSVESAPVDGAFRIAGSKVTVEKSSPSSYFFADEETDIVVTAMNSGASKVRVTLTDSIPEELTLISGELRWDGELDAGASHAMEYAVKAKKSGSIKLPAAGAECIDEEGKEYKVLSDTPVLHVDDVPAGENKPPANAESAGATKSTPTSSDVSKVDVAGFMLSAFIALFALLAIVPSLMYVLIRRG